jgi:hypothetical protein
MEDDIEDEIEDEIDNEIEDEIIETDPDENVHHPLLDDDPSHQEHVTNKKSEAMSMTHQAGFSFRPGARSKTE